jgi:hypothetical protein
MTNQHRDQAFKLACEISFETNPDKKRQLIKEWRRMMDQYLDAVKNARAAHV